MILRIALALGTALSLSACAPQQLESEPATVETEQGPVTCQFYLPQVVIFDAPLSYPEGMSREEAVSVCRREGMARKNVV